MTKAETLVPLVTSARGTGAFTTSTRGTGAFDGTPTNRCQPLPRRAPQERLRPRRVGQCPEGPAPAPVAAWSAPKRDAIAPLACRPPGRQRPTIRGARRPRRRQAPRQGPARGPPQTPGIHRPRGKTNHANVTRVPAQRRHLPLSGSGAHRHTDPYTAVSACDHGDG